MDGFLKKSAALKNGASPDAPAGLPALRRGREDGNGAQGRNCRKLTLRQYLYYSTILTLCQSFLENFLPAGKRTWEKGLFLSPGGCAKGDSPCGEKDFLVTSLLRKRNLHGTISLLESAEGCFASEKSRLWRGLCGQSKPFPWDDGEDCAACRRCGGWRSGRKRRSIQSRRCRDP